MIKASWYDFVASSTDPDAALMQRRQGGTHRGYHDHYVVDGGKDRIILNVLVTPAEVMDNQPMRDLRWWTCFRWKLQPKQVTGDTKYGKIENADYVERVQAYQATATYEKAVRKRKVWAEPLFAEAMNWLGLRRFGLSRL